MTYTTRTIVAQVREIRNYFELTITELATLLGITRQAIYRWHDGKSLPSLKIYWRIEAFYTAAMRFRDADVFDPKRTLHLTVFKNKSLAELICDNKEYQPAISYLIMEQRRRLLESMDTSHYSGQQLHLNFDSR